MYAKGPLKTERALFLYCFLGQVSEKDINLSLNIVRRWGIIKQYYVTMGQNWWEMQK